MIQYSISTGNTSPTSSVNTRKMNKRILLVVAFYIKQCAYNTVIHKLGYYSNFWGGFSKNNTFLST